MLRRIKNLTNSPYPIMLADGKQDILPARGELENVDVHPLHLPLYRMIGYFQIEEADDVEVKSKDTKSKDDKSDDQDDTRDSQPVTSGDPDDESKDEQPGTSEDEEEAEGDEPTLEELRAKYEELTGDKPDGRWKEERLSLEIAQLEENE